VDHDVVETLDVDPRRTTSRAVRARGARDRRGQLLGVATVQFTLQALNDRERGDLIRVNRHEQRVEVLEVH